MIQAFEQLQKEVNKISIENKKLQAIINDYTLFYVSDPKIEKNQNQQIFNNIEKSKIIIINKYECDNEEFFIIGFERTILLIDNKNSFSYLINLFPFGTKICFFNDSENYFKQHSNMHYQKINNNCYLQKEIKKIKENMKLTQSNNFKIDNSISNMWIFISESISLYLINKSYNKAQANRINKYKQNQDNAKNQDILTIKESDYVDLRIIDGSGSRFKCNLIYHIENEELYVVKIPYGTYDPNNYYINQETNNYLKLNHPLIPKFIGKTEDNYIVIEFIDGQTLDQIASSLNYEQSVNVILQIMFIIEFIHYNHFIYNDLKPDNIMIDKNNFVVLIDFDLMIQENEQNDGKISESDYAAPEISNKNEITYYGDIFSIGKIIGFIKFNRSNEKESKLNLLLDDNKNNRPTLYGLIKKIKESCQSKINYNVYDFLFKMNFETAKKNIKLDEKNPYLKINLGFILLEKQKDISIFNQGYNLFKSISEEYKEVQYVLNKIFNLQAQGSKMIDDSIFGYITSFSGESKYKFNDEFIHNLYERSNQNDQDAQCLLGMLLLKLLYNNKELTKTQFQYASNYSYEDYINHLSKQKEVIKAGEKLALNIPVGIKYLKDASKNGHVYASYVLGLINIAKIFKFDDNNSELFNLATIINKDFKLFSNKLNEINHYIKGNIKDGIDYLDQAAKKNCVDAQIILASLYNDPKVCEPDIKKTIYYLELAEKQNNSSAQYMLGKLFYLGKDVEKDIKKAIYYFENADKQNYPFASYDLAVHYFISDNLKEAKFYLTRASDQEFPEAQVMQAILYLKNEINFEDNIQVLYGSAVADKGYIDTKNIIRKILKIDEKPDKQKGINLLSKADEQNNIKATLILGILYFQSNDFDTAEGYFKKGADKKNPIAQYLLAQLYEKFEKPIDIIIKYYRLSANQDFAPSKFALGNYYSKTWNKEYDINKATEKYRKIYYLFDYDRTPILSIDFYKPYRGKIESKKKCISSDFFEGFGLKFK